MDRLSQPWTFFKAGETKIRKLILLTFRALNRTFSASVCCNFFTTFFAFNMGFFICQKSTGNCSVKLQCSVDPSSGHNCLCVYWQQQNLPLSELVLLFHFSFCKDTNKHSSKYNYLFLMGSNRQ